MSCPLSGLACGLTSAPLNTFSKKSLNEDVPKFEKSKPSNPEV
jgi:hypothetical protein